MSLVLATSARSALAFGPEASEWLAGRLLRVIPVKAREPLWSTEVPEFLGERHRQEVVAPERAAILHRFDATRPRYRPAPSILDSLTGLAPFVVARATDDLREAIRWHSPLRGAESLARIAQGVADLSDPFLTTPADVNETAGARAWFSDDLTPGEIDSVSVTSRGGGDPLTEALALARESAARRAAVERAVAKGDRAAVSALRRERLERALAVGSALVERAWREARGPDEEVAPALGLQVEPDPVRSRALLRFANPAAGEGQLELFDPAGRHVVDAPLGRIEAGPQRISIPGGEVGRLPAGLYLVRLSVGGRSFSGRFVRLAP